MPGQPTFYEVDFELRDLDDAILKLAALGLLEIAGKSFRAEFEASYPDGEAGAPPQEKVDQLHRAIKRQERHESFRDIQKAIVPVVTKVAVVFLIFFLGFSTVLITSADAREFFYQLVFTVHDRYSEVVVSDGDNSGDEENPIYTLNYIPDGLELEEKIESEAKTIYNYSDSNENSLIITITNIDFKNQNIFRFDTEDADYIETININQSIGLKIVKQGKIQIVWQNEKTYFVIVSDLESEDVIQIANGIKEKE